MAPDYAKATSAFLPANEPTPDPAFLDGAQPANRRQKEQHQDADYTPPLTPPSEADNQAKELGAGGGGGLKQRKSAAAGHGQTGKKEAPGAGFAQSIKGTVSEQRYVPTDLDQRITQPCKSLLPSFSLSSCGENLRSGDHLPLLPAAARSGLYTDLESRRTGVPRANIAATPEHPYGTTAGNYAELNKERPVLAQHVAFFDKASFGLLQDAGVRIRRLTRAQTGALRKQDGDNILWPLDTWRGFREMGYNFFWCTFAMWCVSSSSSFFRLSIGNENEPVLIAVPTPNAVSFTSSSPGSPRRASSRTRSSASTSRTATARSTVPTRPCTIRRVASSRPSLRRSLPSLSSALRYNHTRRNWH